MPRLSEDGHVFAGRCDSLSPVESIAFPLAPGAKGGVRICRNVDGRDWLVYACQGVGIVAHPAEDKSRGCVVATAPDPVFDAATIGGAIRLAHAADEDEPLEQVKIVDLDVSQLSLLHSSVQPPAPPPLMPKPAEQPKPKLKSTVTAAAPKGKEQE